MESEEEKSNSMSITENQVLNCMFDKWYPVFKKVTFTSEIIPLSEDFISFLQEDGIFVSEDNWVKRQKEEDRYDAYEDPWSEDEEPSSSTTKTPRSFPELEKKIKDVIEKFGGSVFPKLNWSAPQDATWMNTYGTLKCETPSDVILMLKSSDMVAEDLSHAFDACSDRKIDKPAQYTLVLRKFYDIKVAMEFRCFVKNNTLIGVSQRDSSSYFPFLADMKAQLQQKILEFFTANIQNKFFDVNYVFDVYITQNMKVFLVDFGPFGLATDPLLFEWEELYEWDKQCEPELRISSQTGIKPSLAMDSRLPFDLKDMSSTSALSDLMEKMKSEQ